MATFVGSKTPPEHLLTLEEAEERLDPHKQQLDKCIQYGWDAYLTDYAHKHHILSPRARAAIVFDEIVACAEREFSSADGVKFVRRSNSFLLYIGDDITLRFKKMRKNGRCSNIDTRQQMLFKAQAQMHLPTMLEGTLVHAGYVLDDLQRDIARKLVVCQFHNRVLWQFKLTGDSGAVVEFTPAPMPQEPQKPRFEVKTDVAKQQPKVKTAKAGEKE